MSYPTTADVKIKIDGTDRTANIPLHSLTIEDVLTHQIDTATFTVRDGGSFGLVELQTVVISDQSETTRYFAGLISTIASREEYPAIHYQLSCVDSSFLLEKAIINKGYIDQSDYDIIGDMFTVSDPDLSSDIDVTTDVTELLANIERMIFNRITVRNALEQLCARSGGDYYVDYGPGTGGTLANLHYYKPAGLTAPYGLSNTPDLSTTFPYAGLEENKSGSRVINRITIVGGLYLSDDTEFEFEGNGEQTRFVIPFKVQEPLAGGGVQIDVNTGTDVSPVWTSQTVGTGYLDEIASYDSLYYYSEKAVEFATAPSALDRAWRIVGRYEIPLRARVQDEASVAYYGRYFDTVLVDESIEDKATARARGNVILAQQALANPTFRCNVREPGLRSGMLVNLYHSTRSINGNYLIQRMSTRWTGGGYAEYTLELGVYRPDLIDIMLSLKRAKPKPGSDVDDVLDEILLTGETVDSTDDGGSTTLRGPRPYQWAVSTPQQTELIWDFGTWD